MPYSLDNVKDVIEDFVQSNKAHSQNLADGKEGISVNRAIFDIESFLVDLRTTYKLNERLDTSIVSKNILDNFTSISSSDAFNPTDYQLNFLYHLAISHSPKKDLVVLIDEFIELARPEFKLADIVITKSGATRCKTNIRFALNELRNLGFVLSKSNDEKRSWAPSTLGLVAILNLKLAADDYLGNNGVKLFASLRSLKKNRATGSSFSYDPLLVQAIEMFKIEGYFYYFLDKLRYNVNPEDQQFFDDLMKLYIDFVEAGLEITSTGIKMTKAFKEKSEIFQQRLFDAERQNEHVHSKLLQILQRGPVFSSR